MTVSEKHIKTARDIFRSYLRRIEYDRRPCFEHDELIQEMIAAALAPAEREGMMRAFRIAQAEAQRLDRLKTEAEIISSAILSEIGEA